MVLRATVHVPAVHSVGHSLHDDLYLVVCHAHRRPPRAEREQQRHGVNCTHVVRRVVRWSQVSSLPNELRPTRKKLGAHAAASSDQDAGTDARDESRVLVVLSLVSGLDAARGVDVRVVVRRHLPVVCGIPVVDWSVAGVDKLVQVASAHGVDVDARRALVTQHHEVVQTLRAHRVLVSRQCRHVAVAV